MPRLLALVLMTSLLIAGCPNQTGSDPNDTGDPNDPNQAAVSPTWLNGDWTAKAQSVSTTLSGYLEVDALRVTRWGSSTSGSLTIASAPLITGDANSATVNVTVIPTGGGVMNITMQLSRVTNDLATGSILTVSLGQNPFSGTITLTRD